MTDFYKIPQEKFDSFQEIVDRSKGLKVKNIDIQNIKNIDYLNYTFGDFVIVGGHNGNGKSTFIDSIFGAILGHTFWGTDPVKIISKGENKATIVIQLTDGEKEITIERKFSANGNNGKGRNEMLAYMGDNHNNPISQNDLKLLLNVLTVDPMKLNSMNVPDSIKEIKKITGLDTTEIDRIIKMDEEERGFAKKTLEQKQGALKELGRVEKIEMVDAQEILRGINEYNSLDNIKISIKVKLDKAEEIKQSILKLQKDLEDINKEGSDLYLEKQNLETSLNTKYGSLEKLNTKFQEIDEINNKAMDYKQWEKLRKDVSDAEDNVLEREKQVKTNREKRMDMIKNSNLPPYMTIDEDLGILIDGIEFKQVNTAKKVEVAMDLVMLTNNPLRVIRIEEGGEIDILKLKEIKEKIDSKGFQLFLERPIIDEFDMIIMSEGELIENEEQLNKLIETEKINKQNIINSIKNG